MREDLAKKIAAVLLAIGSLLAIWFMDWRWLVAGLSLLVCLAMVSVEDKRKEGGNE